MPTTTDTGAAISDSTKALTQEETKEILQGTMECADTVQALSLILNGGVSGQSGTTDPKKNETALSEEEGKKGIVHFPESCQTKCHCSRSGVGENACLCRITLEESHKSYIFDEPALENTLTPYQKMTPGEGIHRGDYERHYLFVRHPECQSKGIVTGKLSDSEDITSKDSLEDFGTVAPSGFSASTETLQEPVPLETEPLPDTAPETVAKVGSGAKEITPCDRSFSLRFAKDKSITKTHGTILKKIESAVGVSRQRATCRENTENVCYREFRPDCGGTPCKCTQVSELSVGSYGVLNKEGQTGDKLTPHHMPSDGYMKVNVHRPQWNTKINRKAGTEYEKYVTDEGVTLNMQEARHERTFTYKGPSGEKQSWYYCLTPTNALLEDILNVRTIYSQANQYSAAVATALKDVWNENVDVHFPVMYHTKSAVMTSEEYKDCQDKVDTGKVKSRNAAKAAAEAEKNKAALAADQAQKDLDQCTDPSKQEEFAKAKAKADAELKYRENVVTLKGTSSKDENYQKVYRTMRKSKDKWEGMKD